MSKQEIELKEGMTWMVKDGKLVIETSEEYTPKRGDFVTLSDDWISVYAGNGNYKGTISDFCGTWLKGSYFKDENPANVRVYRNIRPSTNDEIAKFHALLAKSGKQWDPNQVKIVDLKWEPKRGEVVKCVNGGPEIMFIYERMSGNFYCGFERLYYLGGEICISFSEMGTICLPTTREDRCKFFEALIKAGYKWDSKKMKLTKREAKWEPKDGDFVSNQDYIFIFSHFNGGCPYRHISLGKSNGELNVLYPKQRHCLARSDDALMKATDSERQQLIDALAKAGKRWNAELRIVENIKPEYKEGDFLRTKSGGVFIYKHKDGFLLVDHAYLGRGGNLMMDDSPACHTTYIAGYATDGQKQKLIDALAKDGKIWNATKKRIEDIKPKVVEMTMEQVCEKLGMNVKIVKR